MQIKLRSDFSTLFLHWKPKQGFFEEFEKDLRSPFRRKSQKFRVSTKETGKESTCIFRTFRDFYFIFLIVPFS